MDILPSRPCFSALLVACLCLVPSPAFSQSPIEAPKPGGPDKADAGGANAEVEVQMSVFEVRTDRDTGYAALNTTSGSRLNTSLKDTPAAISVFTTQFIEDIGATNVDDLVEYSVNTSNNLLGGGSSQLSGTDPIISVRGIDASGSGLPGSGGGRFTNFFRSTISQDTYNTERAELTRGPNSVLYGVGSPAGGFNVSTKKADVRRQQYGYSFRFGSYEQARGTFDLNQPIIRDKLALRLNGVYEDRNDSHPFAYKHDQRWQIAARWQVAKNTRLDAEYEHGSREFSTATQTGILDSITPWIAAGRQLDTQVGAPFPAKAGMQLLSTANVFVYDMTAGKIYNMRNQSVSAPAGATVGVVAGTGEQQRQITDYTVVPRNVFLGGPGFGNSNDFNRTTVIFSHELVRNLSFEAAYNREAVLTQARDTLGTANLIEVDTNAFLPDGAPNPHAGQFYTEQVATHRNQHPHSDDYRLSASYDFDFSDRATGVSRWLGHHRFAALYEFREEGGPSDQEQEYVIQNPFNPATPDSTQNRLDRRSYFDLNGPVGRIGLADDRQYPVNGLINESTGQPVTSAYFPFGTPRDPLLRTNTNLYIWQASVLRNRLVTTFGYRTDRTADFESTALRGAPFGPFAQGALYAIQNPDAFYTSGITRTQGVVAHPLSWASLFYNHSSAISLPALNVRVYSGTFAPASAVPSPSSRGETNDAGVKFTLLKEKLFATITYYETDANQQSANGGLGPYRNAQNIPAIWNTLNNAGVLAANGLAIDQVLAGATDPQGSLFNKKSRGWEFELTANPTRNWRVMLNLSANKTVASDTALEIRNYYAANQAFWLEGNRARLIINGQNGQLAATAIDPNDGVTTIAEALQTQLTALDAQFVAPDGARAIGPPVATGNLRTSYVFREGVLRGFSIGGGGRWRGERVVAYTSSDPTTRQEIRSAAELTVDANLAYQRKMSVFGGKRDLTVQLNVTNLIDNEAAIIMQAYPDGRTRSFSIPVPRAWFVTTSVKW